jgi:O-antigen/teichoic acid export membrane protein
MMNKSFTGNFLSIYFWQGIAIILNLLSLFIVTPLITRDPVIYGIYSLCVFITIFLSYADIGFLGAGYKYASENYAKNDLHGEIKIIGFVGFILMIFCGIYELFVGLLIFKPQFLISNLSSPVHQAIASNMFIILFFSAPLFILQRIFQMIFGIRLEDYVYQRVNAFFNLIKIASVYLFINPSGYNIVGYFMFIQAMNLLAAMVTLGIVRSKYKYDLIELYRSIRFSKEVYIRTRVLAFGSLFATIAWIIVYELDLLVIAKLLGPEMIAYYAVGLTLISFFRSIYGTLFNPFSARFNHFVALKDIDGLKKYYFNILVITLPLTVFPILSLSLLMKPFIYCWVGPHYLMSIPIASLLVLSYVFSCISYPGGLLITAQERVRSMIIFNTIMCFVYWGGISLTYPWLGLLAFGLFKFVTFSIIALMYLVISMRFIDFNIKKMFNKVLLPALLPIATIIIGAWLALPFLPTSKGVWNLLTVIITGAGLSLIALMIYYMIARDFRDYVHKVLISKIRAIIAEKIHTRGWANVS